MQEHSFTALTHVLKRDGSEVPLDFEKLKASIRNALSSVGAVHNPLDGKLAGQALDLVAMARAESGRIATSQIREAVQTALLQADQGDAAQSYAVFRYIPKSALQARTGAPVQFAPGEQLDATLFPLPTQVRKRDGEITDFDIHKIAIAIHKAGNETGTISLAQSKQIAEEVTKRLAHAYAAEVPTVEQIQDMVEIVLMKENYVDAAKSYILYRNKRAELRKQQQRTVPEHVKKLATESKGYFRNPLSEFIYYRTYSRWKDEEGRRETWIETVDRYMSFMRENIGDKLTADEYIEVRQAVLNQEAMPSMRLLQFAGPAARKTNVCAYNCSYIAPEGFQDFGEIMYISMCGTGVGFSVESKNVQKLSQIALQTGEKLPTHVVPDTKEGWADALVLGMKTWFGGKDVEFDYSQIRPAGARLRTMGGRSSGPDPLRSLLNFTREKILKKQGRRLTNIDVHDIICKIGEVVVAGGVRRSALISLSDLDDPEMRDAKKGQFYNTEPQRSMANNSAVYEMKPTNEEFMDEWISLMKSGTGERGIFNRAGLGKTLPERRMKTLKGYLGNLGTNPCGEIILQSKQFCNLSEVVARPDDTEETLIRKVRIAAILGTYQSTLVNLGYLSEEWRKNCETERLLGVSVTGQWDCPTVRDKDVLARLRDESVRVNKVYAERFGIPQSTCVTCVKPSGNLSQTVDCSSGMHPRHAQYYIRRVRISANDSLFSMMRDQKIPHHPEVGQTYDGATTMVLEFPMKAPDGAVVKDDVSALDQLEHWKMVKEHFTEHNPSVTISIGDDEWIEVANWLYNNWEIIGGLSFLPRSNHAYQLAPYEEIDKERYDELKANFPQIDFSQILIYEKEDETDVASEVACAGGACEIDVDMSTLKTEVATTATAVVEQETVVSESGIEVDTYVQTETTEVASESESDLDEFTKQLRERVKQALESDA